MQVFEFTVKIQANNNDEAKKILTAMFEIKKAVSTEDLLMFANAIKKKPGLINRAKMFI